MSIDPRTADAAAQSINAANARRTSRAEAGADFIVALVVAILLAAALVHFATPCAEAALCAAVLPTRCGWLQRALLHLRARYLMRLIRSAEDDLAWQDQQEDIARWELQQIPRQRAVTRQQLDVLRLQLRDIDLSTRSR